MNNFIWLNPIFLLLYFGYLFFLTRRGKAKLEIMADGLKGELVDNITRFHVNLSEPGKPNLRVGFGNIGLIITSPYDPGFKYIISNLDRPYAINLPGRKKLERVEIPLDKIFIFSSDREQAKKYFSDPLRLEAIKNLFHWGFFRIACSNGKTKATIMSPRDFDFSPEQFRLYRDWIWQLMT